MICSSHKKMATLIAAIASGLTAIVLISISACGGGTRLWIVFVGVISAFVAVYSVTLYLLNRFIFEKINPIYKTIHSLNLPFKQFKKQLNSRDFVSEIYRDVQYWAEEKSQEIDRLKEMENYRKEFLGNVSHELKTPISTFRDMFLLSSMASASLRSTGNIWKTEKSINRLISIVEDLGPFQSGNQDP